MTLVSPIILAIFTHTHTHTHCTLLLIQSLSLPSALLEEFDLTWESMNSSTQQNAALPQSTGSRQESVLYADASLDMLLDELCLLFGYYLCDEDTQGSDSPAFSQYIYSQMHYSSQQMCSPSQLHSSLIRTFVPDTILKDKLRFNANH